MLMINGVSLMNDLAELISQLGLSGSIITGIIILLFIIGFYTNLYVRRRYMSLSQELAAFCAGDIEELKSDILTWITEEYKECILSGIENVNTPAIIDVGMEAFHKPCRVGESLLAKINGLLVSLGLFGTFLGLTSALGKVGELISGSSAESLIAEAGLNTFRMLLSSFEGMSVAFVTSLFGVGLSIIFSVMTTFIGYNGARDLLVTELEEYLDVRVAGEALKEAGKKDKNDDEKAVFSDVIESMTLLKETISSYINDINFLKDFNRQLKENLDHAEKSIFNFNLSLDRTSQAFDKSSMKMAECSDELKSLVNEIKYQGYKMDAMSIVFSELSKKLDETSQDRNLFLKVISEIPDRLLNYTEAAVAKVERGV